MADSSSLKSNRLSNPHRKVRVIGKMRGFTVKELESQRSDSDLKSWITVKKPEENGSERCRIFVENQSTSRKDGYELDYFYEQDEEIGQLYSREIKPLILEVFDGRNASVVALGARGSGKTYLIQGSKEKPGLAVMAMSDILSKARELGKSVCVSLYEMTPDNVNDLLDPKYPSVHVLEDAQGKINLKGLSQVPIKSLSEFHSKYFSQVSLQSTKKMSMEQRTHKGLMVHISSEDDPKNCKLVNKMNFVELAGYEDPRKSSKDGIISIESSRINKSFYALLDVVSAINMNESRVPYRGCKLTRILQDSLGGTSHLLLLTCLNPSFCQESLSSISLVSRSCRSNKQVLTDSTNRSQGSAKVKDLSSSKGGKTVSFFSAKKQVGHSQLPSGNNASSTLKGRNLYAEGKMVTPKQLRCRSADTSALKSKVLPNLALVVAPLSLDEALQDKSISECSSTVEIAEIVSFEGPGSQPTSKLPKTGSPTAPTSNDSIPAEPDVPPHDGTYHLGATPIANVDAEVILHLEAANTCEDSSSLLKQEGGSLSEQIREISNNLKLLCASTTSRTNNSEEVVASHMGYDDIAEPKTPTMECAKYCSPQGTFTDRSSRVKHSLVQEYLNFLNSASKEELKSLKGIGEKRANYILELREESPTPFTSLDDLQDIGLSAKQIKGMMKTVAGQLFS